jgi:hypothetical protein
MELGFPFRRIILHLAVWAGVLIFWLFITRAHHPTLIVAAAATMVLVSAFAVAVYANALWLVPKFAVRRVRLRYAAYLLAVIGLLDLMTVLSIQLVYDLLRVPREGRYGFWLNMASDGAGIAIHVAASMFVIWIAGYLRRGRTRGPIEG